MKYIHIVQFHQLSGGGVGSVVKDLSEAMSKSGNAVYIISLFSNKNINYKQYFEWAELNNIKALYMHEHQRVNILQVLQKLRRTISELSRDEDCCLYLHLKWGVLAGVASTIGIKNIKRVEIYHSGYMRYKLQSFICKPYINSYIAVSQEAKTQLVSWFGIDKNKIKVIYNGVDIDHIRSIVITEHEFKKEVNFISVGRLSFEKGFLDSIRAYTILRKKGRLANSTYLMIGNGCQRTEAEELAEGYVDFLGLIPRDQVYLEISKADVVILPSLWEGNSIVLLEVLAIGRPIIVTDIPSFQEVLNFKSLSEDEDFRIEKFGVIYKKGDSKACERALCAVENSIEQLSSMAQYVYSLANQYSVNKQAELYQQESK